MHQSLSMGLAEYAAATSIESIPVHVRNRAKQVVLDEMASAFFCRRTIVGGLSARYTESLGGTAEASVIGTAARVPAPHAALANGAAGHGEEVDGTHVVGGHPGATLVHAAIAVAERLGATGAELVNAVVLGYDVGVRLAEACGGKFSLKGRHHLYADFLFAVGASVACSRLLRLDPIRHCHAMALSTFQTNALAAVYQERQHISKSLCNGQFAAAGVSAALMSEIGLEGVEDILGAPDGLLEAWGLAGREDRVTRQLGNNWSILGANFKFINAGYPIHTAVEAALELLTVEGLDAAGIESIHIGMPRNAMRVVDDRQMQSICAQDMVCAAIVQGGLKLRARPFPALLHDPAFLKLRARVTLGVDLLLERDQPDGRGSNVTLTTTAGRIISLRIDHPRGHSERGIVTWPQLSDKWIDGLPACDVERMVTLAQNLDQIEDVRDFVAVFRTAD